MASVSVSSSLFEYPAARVSSLLRTFVVVGAAALVTACGGGGGGGGSSGGPKVDPNLSVPVAAGYNRVITNGLQVSAKLDAVVDGDKFKGDATITFTAATAATFESQSAQASRMVINGSVKVDGDTIALDPYINTTYVDSNYKTLGAVVTDLQSNVNAYSVVTSSNPLPATGVAGNFGPLDTYTTYSGPGKISTIGSIKSRYVVETGTSSNTLNLRIIMDFYSPTQVLGETDTYLYSIDSAGNIKLLSVVVSTPTGLDMTYTAQ